MSVTKKRRARFATQIVDATIFHCSHFYWQLFVRRNETFFWRLGESLRQLNSLNAPIFFVRVQKQQIVSIGSMTKFRCVDEMRPLSERHFAQRLWSKKAIVA